MAIFKINEHSVERIVRVLVGAVLVSLVFVGPETPWGLLGFILIATGAFGFCPIYRMFGISTAGSKSKEGAESSSESESGESTPSEA